MMPTMIAAVTAGTEITNEAMVTMLVVDVWSKHESKQHHDHFLGKYSGASPGMCPPNNQGWHDFNQSI